MVPSVLLKTIAWWGIIYTLRVLNVAENTRVNVWCNLSPEMWNKLHRGWKPMVLLKLTVLLQLKTVFRQLIWTNIPTQWHPSGVESHNVPSSLLPSTQSSKRNMETPLLAPQELNDQNSQKGGPGGGDPLFHFLSTCFIKCSYSTLCKFPSDPLLLISPIFFEPSWTLWFKDLSGPSLCPWQPLEFSLGFLHLGAL